MDCRKAKRKRKQKSALINGMEAEEVLQAFETLARTLNIKVRYDKGDFKGAMCRVGDENLLLLQKDADLSKNIHVFARELSKINLDGIYIMPVLRHIIEDYKDPQ